MLDQISGFDVDLIVEKNWFPIEPNDPDYIDTFRDDHWYQATWLVYDNVRIIPFTVASGAKYSTSRVNRVLGEIGTTKDCLCRITVKLLTSTFKIIERTYMSAAVQRYSDTWKECDIIYIARAGMGDLHSYCSTQVVDVAYDGNFFLYLFELFCRVFTYVIGFFFEVFLPDQFHYS